jgi:hypothetical protein
MPLIRAEPTRAHRLRTPGDEVEIASDEDRIVIAARRQPGALGGRFAHSGMADRLLEDRRREPR